MREELLNDELEQVQGGVAFVNYNTMKVAFSTTRTAYQLKNCTGAEAQALCSSFIGKCKDESDYDQKCINALSAKGWI